MLESFNDTIFNAGKEFIYIRDRLNHIGSAFNTTGNTKMAEELWGLADVVGSRWEAVKDAWVGSIRDQCSASEQATVNLIQGVLSGIVIGNTQKSADKSRVADKG